MNGGMKIQLENLNPELVEEAQLVLSELSVDGRGDVMFSPELALIISKFLGAALEEGAIAFWPVTRLERLV